MLLRLIYLLVLCVIGSGCGYVFQGSGSVLPPDVKNVYVPRVENDTTEIGLSTSVTEALRDRFERYGVLTVVDNVAQADATLQMKIVSLKRQTRSVSSTDTALQYDLVMTLAGDLRRVTGPVLWRSPGVKVTKSVGSTSDVVVTSSADFAGGLTNSEDLSQLDDLEVFRGQEQEAILSLSDEAARKIYESAVTPDF